MEILLMGGTAAVIAYKPRFKPGDLVRVREDGRRRKVWRVLAEDTNKASVNDPEPAYHIERADMPLCGRPNRYAYESDLVPA